MKKILSLVLAGAMTLGMAATGFATLLDGKADIVGFKRAATVPTIIASGEATGSAYVGGVGTFTSAQVGAIVGNGTTVIDPAKGWEIELDMSALLVADFYGVMTDPVAGVVTTVTDSFGGATKPTRDYLSKLKVQLTGANANVATVSNVNGYIRIVGVTDYLFKENTTAKFSLVITAPASPAGTITNAPETDRLTINFTAPIKGGVVTVPTKPTATYDYNDDKNTITVTFDREMNKSKGGVTFNKSGVSAAEKWADDGKSVVYTLSGSGWLYDTSYTATFADYEDTAGNVMPTDTFSFTTGESGSYTGNRVVNATATDFAPGYSLYYGYSPDYNRYYLARTGRHEMIDLGDVYAADEVKLRMFLMSDMFIWKESGVPSDAVLTSQVVRKSKISTRTQVAAGSQAINKVEIDYLDGAAYVKVKFIDEWVSVDELDFEFTTYLLIDSRRRDTDGEGLTFSGTLKNYVIFVYENDNYVDTSLGEVAHAQDFVKDIEVDLGAGVSIFTKFFKDKKYYGTATRDADEAADVVFAKYPDVDNVVILKTVGLNSTGDIVKLDTDYSDYYVYDKDLNYLGQSNTRLPFSSRYYLANRKLDIDDGDYEAPEEPEWDGSAETGGDDGLTNANANPGTGC